MRINVADRIRLGQQPVSRVYLGPSLIWTADPALDLVFDGRALDPRMSFSRPSTATLFNSSGVLLSSGLDQLRYDHDPVTLVPRGLLVEEQRTNYNKNSEYSGFNDRSQFDLQGSLGTAYFAQSFFTERGRRVRRLRFVNPQVQRISYPQVFQEAAMIPNGQCASSFWRRFVEVTANTPNYITFIGNRPNPAGFVEEPSAYRVNGISNVTNNYDSGYEMLIVANTTISIFSTTIEASCRQFELGPYPTSYIPTTGTARTRAADTAALNPQGWLSAEKGVFVLQHDVPAGRPLLGNGSAALLNSVGPGRTAFRYDGSGATVVHNGGAPQSVTFPTFAASLQLLGAGAARANSAVSRLTYYPRRLTVQELQEMTA